jgi:hypothetical protein
LLPIAAQPGPQIPGFVALFDTGFLVTKLSTSFLLFARFREIRTWSLLVLCCAYLYSALITIPHLLMFPGAVLDDVPVIATSAQSTSWIFLLWTGGFAGLAFVSVFLEARFGDRRIAPDKTGFAVAIGLCAVLVALAAVVIMTLGKIDGLPAMIVDSKSTELALVGNWSVVAVLAASVVVILLVIRQRSPLYLWLSLSLGTMMLANALANVGGGRFTISWTSARLGWLVSAFVLFIYLLSLSAQHYRLLARTAELIPNMGDAATGDSTQQPENWSAEIESFIARENVARFQKMLDMPNDEATARVLRRLLAEEQGRLVRQSISKASL